MSSVRYFIFISFVFIIIRCTENASPDVTPDNVEGYIKTLLPKDTTQLWIASGDLSKDTVILVGEGGPKSNLDFQSNGRVYWEYLPNNKNYYYVVVHQSSTYNKSILDATNFTVQDAEAEVDNTSEILYRAIKYFKDRDKYVVVFGHSYSAWVVPHYFSTRQSLADKYIITGGRLNADSTQTAFQLKGINTGFDEDGKTLLLPDEKEEPNPHRTERYWRIRKNKELLKYAIGKVRYTKELIDVDLSKLVYYFGKYDENVGALSDEEIEFLENNGASVIGVETNHYKIWQKVIDAFREDTLKL